MTDTETPTTVGADEGDDGVRIGACLDGPLAGQRIASRYPKGLLVCDRPAGQVWIYDWIGDGFRARPGACPMPLVEDDTADDNRWRAAEEGEYDVIAAPWVGAATWVDPYADQPDNDREG